MIIPNYYQQHNPTPEQLAAVEKADKERKEKCKWLAMFYQPKKKRSK